MKKLITALLCAAMLFAAVSCADPVKPAGTADAQTTTEEITSTEDITTADPDTADSGTTDTPDPAPTDDFDMSLTSFVEKTQTKSYVISPLSFRYALGMLAAGARGETLEQMVKGLGDLNEFEELIKQFNSFEEGFNAKLKADKEQYDNARDKTYLTEPKGALRTADSVWKRSDLDEFLKEYKLRLEMYGAEYFDFTPEDVIGRVNVWANEKTEGMIPTILPDDYDVTDLAVVLMNALYYKNSWGIGFSKEGALPFTTYDGKTVDRSGEQKGRMERPTIPEYTGEAVRIAVDSSLKTNELDILMLLPQPRAVETADDYRQYLQRSLVNSLMKLRMNALSFDDPSYAKGSIQYSRFLATTGVTDATVELTKGKLRQGICDFMRAQKQIFTYGFTSSEIARAKKSLLSSMRNKVANGRQSRSANLMDEIYADYYDGNRMISRKDELQLVERYLPAMDSLSMLQFVKHVFESRPQHFLLRGGNDVGEEFSHEHELHEFIGECRRQPVDRYWRNIDVPDALTQLRPTLKHIVSERPIREIDATDIRLDNGARVIFRRSDTENDRLALSAFRKGGQYGLDSTR